MWGRTRSRAALVALTLVLILMTAHPVTARPLPQGALHPLVVPGPLPHTVQGERVLAFQGMPLSAPYAIFDFKDTGPSAVNLHTGYVYVSNGISTTTDALHRITIYDPSRAAVVGFVDGISGPMVYEPVHDQLYVATGTDLAIVNCTQNAIVATLPGVGRSGWSPGGITLDALDGLVYVAYNNLLEGALAVVSVSTHAVTRIDGLWHSNGIAWNPRYNEIYVTFDAVHKIAVIRPSDNRIVAMVEGVYGPQGIVYDPLDRAMYAPYFDGAYVNQSGQWTIAWQAGVVVIDGATHRIVANITGFHAGWDGPKGIEFNPHDGNLYVANGTAVVALNGTGGTWIGPVTRFADYHGQGNAGPLSYNPVDHRVYASAGDGLIAVDAGMQGVANIGYDFSFPFEVASVPASGVVYTTNRGTSSVVRIDARTHRIVGHLDGFGRPDSVTYDPDADALVIGNEANNTLSLVSLKTNQTFATITDVLPWDVEYDSRSRNLFVGTDHGLRVIPGSMKGTATDIDAYGSLVPLAVDSVHGRVFARANFYSPQRLYFVAFDTSDLSVLWNLTVPDFDVISLAYDSHHDKLYAGLGTTGVAVLNASTGQTIATIAGPFDPVAVLFNPTNEYIYVADQGSTEGLWVIDPSTNKVVQTIHLPDQPNRMTYDPDSQEIYIACGMPLSRPGFVVAVPSLRYSAPGSPILLGLIGFGGASAIVIAIWLVVRRRRGRGRLGEATRPPEPIDPKGGL